MKRILLLLVAVLTVSGLAMSQNSAKINVSKKAINVNVQTNEVSTQTLILMNKGGENLNFSIADIETSSHIDQGPVMASSTTGDNPGDKIDYFISRAKSGSQDAPWLKMSQPATTIAPNGNTQIDLTFDATGLAPALYTAGILVSSNDQDNPYEIIPITFSVTLGPAAGCQVFVTDDNENNAGTGTADGDFDNYLCYGNSLLPIEANLFLDAGAAITSAQLSIMAYDVDETAGEIDIAYLNGTMLGPLTGNNGQWNTTVFNVNPALINNGPGAAGKNLIQVYNTVSGWCVEIDWYQLIVNNCVTGNAFFRYVNIDATCYTPGSTVETSIEVDTDLASQLVRVETLLLDENDISVDGQLNTFTVNLTADEPLTVYLTIPNGATLGSTYKVQAIVYDANTNLQQDLEEVPLLVNDPCTQPVPISNWAIVLGVFLIGVFMVVRYRRRLA